MNKELIYEAFQIAAKQTMKQPTQAHLMALLEERADLVNILCVTCDGLTNAKECLADYSSGSDREVEDLEMCKAYLTDANDAITEAEFLERKEPKWVTLLFNKAANERLELDTLERHVGQAGLSFADMNGD